MRPSLNLPRLSSAIVVESGHDAVSHSIGPLRAPRLSVIIKSGLCICNQKGWIACHGF